MSEVFKKEKMYLETWFWCFMIFNVAGWIYEVVVFAFSITRALSTEAFYLDHTYLYMEAASC